MSAPITLPAPVDLDALEQLERAAFCAPWRHEPFAVMCEAEDPCGDEHEVLRIESPCAYPDGQIVADVPGLRSLSDANAELIVAARNALPTLIAELRAVRVERDRLAKAIRLARSLTMGARVLLPASNILLPEETIEAKRLLADCERLLDTALSEPTKETRHA